jgi:hypothetical protein
MLDTEPRLQAALSDRYRLERELGSGGMATVCLAFHLTHEREVALKILRPELGAVLGSDLGADRLLAEITITARLDHPHILTLIDSGVADTFFHEPGGAAVGFSRGARAVSQWRTDRVRAARGGVVAGPGVG